MAAQQQDFAGHAVATTLTAALNSTALTFSVASTSGWPSSGLPFTLTIDQGIPALEEVVFVTSYAANVVTLDASKGRGYDNGSAQGHAIGAAVVHTPDAEWFKDISARAFAVSTIGDIPYVSATSGVTMGRVPIGASGDVLTAVSGVPAWAGAPADATKLPLAGGTMSGPIAMGANKVTGLANGSASTDAAAYGQIPAQVAGKNAIINADFGIWQRGTTFNNAGSFSYCADRFYISYNNSGATINVTQQAFTPGSAPVAGYESAYYLQWAQTVAGTTGSSNELLQLIEDVRRFAGQTVTFSFWAKFAATSTIDVVFGQYFGSGGSGTVETNFQTGVSIGTTWQRYSFTLNVPSIAGDTIGTPDAIYVYLNLPLGSVFTFDTWGWQLEAGSTATEFTTASGSVGGELALCQRYYWQTPPSFVASAWIYSATDVNASIQFPVQMRATPSFSTSGSLPSFAGTTALTLTSASAVQISELSASTDQATSGGTAGQGGQLRFGTGTYNFSAEL